MQELLGIRATPIQEFTTVIPDGEITFILYFRPNVQSWYLNIEFAGQSVYGIRVNVGADILGQYKSRFPFGLNVDVSEPGYEPTLIDDFVTGRVIMSVLSRAEQDQIRDIFQDVANEV